jgi:hypothetical protein
MTTHPGGTVTASSDTGGAKVPLPLFSWLIRDSRESPRTGAKGPGGTLPLLDVPVVRWHHGARRRWLVERAPSLLYGFHIALRDTPGVLTPGKLEGMRKHRPVPAPAPYCLGSDL